MSLLRTIAYLFTPQKYSDGDVLQNHFLREGDTAWWVVPVDYWPLPQPRIINLENNYWGTTDTALLDQWIYDGNDNEDVDIFIDYLPLADGPVQTESTTWGAVKSLVPRCDEVRWSRGKENGSPEIVVKCRAGNRRPYERSILSRPSRFRAPHGEPAPRHQYAVPGEVNGQRLSQR